MELDYELFRITYFKILQSKMPYTNGYLYIIEILSGYDTIEKISSEIKINIEYLKLLTDDMKKQLNTDIGVRGAKLIQEYENYLSFIIELDELLHGTDIIDKIRTRNLNDELFAKAYKKYLAFEKYIDKLKKEV